MTITRNFSILANGAGSANTLSLGGATLGSNALAVTGSSLFPGSTSISSAGLVGIGMTPSNILDITQSTNGGAVVKILNSNGGTGAYNQFYASNGTNYATLTHTGTGWTTSGMTRQDGTWLTGTGAGGLSIFTGAVQPIYFGINNAEKARIDTSGRLILGATSSTYLFYNAGTSYLGGDVLCGDRITAGGGGIFFDASYGFYDQGAHGLTVTGYGATALFTLGQFTYDPAGAQILIRAGGSGGVLLTSGAGSWVAYSDETMKTIVEPITGGLDKIVSCRAVIGRYNDDYHSVRRPFLIAQDIMKVLPEAVDYKYDVTGEDPSQDGKLLLAYTETIPLIFSAFKDVKTELDAANAAIAALTARLTALETK